MLYRATPKHAAPRPRRSLSKKRKYLLIGAIVPLLVGGAAFAYFDANYGTGHVNVAAAPSFTINVGQPTGTSLSPGSGQQVVGFTISNQLTHAQTVNGETYTVTSDLAGGVLDTITDTYVDTCQASWFTIVGSDGGVTLPDTLQPGQSIMGGTMTVTMPANATIDQSACAALSPQVEVSLS